MEPACQGEKKIFMPSEVPAVELVYHFDEFLWEEELTELSIASKCHESLVESLASTDPLVVAKWILGAIPASSDRTDSYSLLMALASIILDQLHAGRYTTEWGRNVKEHWSKLRDLHIPLFEKLSAQLALLIGFVTTNQVSLVRDASRISLSRQHATVTSTSSQYEPSVLSSKIRICLNMLYFIVIASQHEPWLQPAISSSRLHETLRAAVVAHVDNVIPIRKVILFIFKLLSFFGRDSDLFLPSNTPGLAGSANSSPLAVLLHFVPLLKLPKLSDFRSFVALGVHVNSLVNWTSPDGIRPRPAAVDEAIGIALNQIRSFIESYDFHEAEIELIRTDPSLLTTFQLYVEMQADGKVGKLRSNLLRPKTKTNRFSMPELVKHMIANYQVTSAGGDSSSECESVQEAFQSCQSWLGQEAGEEALIEAIAEAAVPLPFPDNTEKGFCADTVIDCSKLNDIYTPQVLQECLVILLKLFLSSCRGAVDPILSPTNQPSFDLDRDHLLTVLERFDLISPPSTPRDSCLRRNFEIICCAVTGILLLLLRVLPDRSELVQRTIVSNNGCLVLLKLITSYPNDPAPQISIFPDLRDNKSWTLAVPGRLPTALFRSLKSLYVLCKHNVPRIKKYLIHYKVAVVLKRFFAYPNVGILKIAYKLFKIQIRFLGKKWKVLHIRLLSCCSNATPLDPIDDWILNDPEVADVQGLSDDILNDSHMPATPEKIPFCEESYLDAMRKINFERKEEIEAFCRHFDEPEERFFGSKSLTSYNDWLAFTLGS
jgi:hypothetical protein